MAKPGRNTIILGGLAVVAVLGWLASHPSAGERAEAYRDAAREGADYPPVLSEAEFAALKSMCEDDPDVEEFGFF